MAVGESLNEILNQAVSRPLRFHWRLPYGGETSGIARADHLTASAIGSPDTETQIPFCRRAEECGIDSLLLDFGFGKPDPMLLAATLGRATEKIRFIVAYRSGIFSPTMFVQQLNTLSALIGGRLLLNIVAGYSPEEQRAYGDFLAHDERYERTEEFLEVCRAFWSGEGEVNFTGKYYRIEKGMLKTPFVSADRTSPEIMVGGGSVQAQRLAARHGTCWMQLADAPEKLQDPVSAILRQGVEAGLRMYMIVRPRREDAVLAAYSIIAGFGDHERRRESAEEFMRKTDSVSFKAAYHLGDTEWLTPNLWTGAVRVFGSTAVCLVGDPDEIASALMQYKAIGISQFILSGWPKLDEMVNFGRLVLPIIRQKENEIALNKAVAGRKN